MQPRFLSVLFLLVVLPAQGAEFTNPSECMTGKRVTHRSGKSGVVTGLRSGMCLVRHDDGTESTYLHWTLSPAGGAKAAPMATGGGLSSGNYACTAPGAGTFPIIIRGNRYTDRAGKSGDFKLQADSVLVFESGSLAGQYSKLMGPGKFGLSSAKGKMFYTVCNLK